MILTVRRAVKKYFLSPLVAVVFILSFFSLEAIAVNLQPKSKTPVQVQSTTNFKKQIVASGYCCKEGQLYSTIQTDCQKQRGIFFTNKREADLKCTGFCCDEGTVSKATKETCRKQGGIFLGKEQDADNRCKKDQGFCCIDGEVSESTTGICKKEKGSFYRSERVAAQNCQGYCNHNGKTLRLTEDQCNKQKGNFFARQSLARKDLLKKKRLQFNTKDSGSGLQASSTMMGATNQRLPDLTVRSVNVSNNTPQIGTTVKVNATIFNQSSENVSTVVVHFTYQGKSQTRTIKKIGRQQSEDTSADITIEEPSGPQVVEVYVNPSRIIKEKDHTNNRQQKIIQARASLKISANNKLTISSRELPDITSALPNSLEQGTKTRVKLRGENIDSSFLFDFGNCISQVGKSIFSDEIQLTLQVSSDCQPGNHPIKIKTDRREYTATAMLMVTPELSEQQPVVNQPRSSPASHPPPEPEMQDILHPVDSEQQEISEISQQSNLSQMVDIKMQPNIWQQGHHHQVTFEGPNLNKVKDIKFGDKIHSYNQKRTGTSLITLSIGVEKDAPKGKRDIKILFPSESGNGNYLIKTLDAYVQDAYRITLVDSNGYNASEDHLTSGHEYIWKEIQENVADEFELQIVTKNGDVLVSHRQLPDNLHRQTQHFKSDVSFLNSIYEAVAEYQANNPSSEELPVTVASNNQKITTVYWQVLGGVADETVEISQRWELRLSGDGPTGLMCNPTEILLDVSAVGDDGEKKSAETAFYPGQKLAVHGTFSIPNNPWIVVAGLQGELHYQGGQTTTGYDFDNIFIDWGDGSYEPISARLPAEAEGRLEYIDGVEMEMDMEHTYTRPNKYPVRIYVVPDEAMGYLGYIAGQNNVNNSIISSSAPAEKEHILLAAVGNTGIKFEKKLPKPNKTTEVLPVVSNKGAEAADLIFQAYCNPLNIYVVQDIDATGPLQLQSIEITGFSTDGGSSSASSPGLKGNTSESVSMKKTRSSASLSSQKTKNSGSASLQNMESNIGNNIMQTAGGADTTVSTCDIGLWADAKLKYYGQGYVKLEWLVDGMVIHTAVEKIGPSKMRKGLTANNKESWGEPISTEYQLTSPRLPIRDPDKHILSIKASIEEDTTLSTVNSVALQSIFSDGKSQSSDSGGSALPPTSKNSLDFSFVPTGIYDAKKSGNQYSVSRQKSSASFDLSNPPYWVFAPPKTYEVIKNSSELPCSFKFPVADGTYFEVANLNNLVVQGKSTYSGNGALLINLPDTAYTVSEYFIPISFSGWSVSDGETVQKGELHVQSEKRLDSLPAMTATLKQLSGQARVSVDATMDIEIKDPTLYLVQGETQKWDNLTAILTPAGDWHFSELNLPLTRLGWSLADIESPDVRIDLSHSWGINACNNMPSINAGNDLNWVGVHLGNNALLHPYMFNFTDATMPAPNWGIVADGVCGEARTNTPFSAPFGEGGLGWEGISITAGGGQIDQNYSGFFVDMTWPQLHLTGGDVSISYSSGDNEPAIPHLNLQAATNPHEKYGAVDMLVDVNKFEAHDGNWGIVSTTTFTFHERDNEVELVVPDLFFDVFNKASFEKGTASSITQWADINFPFGGAQLTIESAGLDAGVRKIDFSFAGKLDLGGLAETTTDIGYSIFDGDDSLTSEGPIIGNFSPITKPFPGGNVVAESTLSNLRYIAPGEDQGQGQQKMALLASNSYTSSGIFSDAWPLPGSFPLLADTDAGFGDYSASLCSGDTFGGIVKTKLFESDKELNATFRFGGNDTFNYWLMHSDIEVDRIAIYPPYLYIHKFIGGLGYNIDPESLPNNKDHCTAVPAQTGEVFRAGVGVHVLEKEVLSSDGILTVNGNVVRIDNENITVMGQKDVCDQGYIEYTNGELLSQSTNCTLSFFDDQVSITGNNEIFISENSAHLYLGTPQVMDKIEMFKIKDGHYYVKGHSWFNYVFPDNFSGGIDANINFSTPEVLQCSLSYDGGVSGDFTLGIKPFSLTASTRLSSTLTFVNPIEDVSIGDDMNVNFGCCGPVSLGMGYDTSVLGIPVGFDLDLLPLPLNFDPYVSVPDAGDVAEDVYEGVKDFIGW